MVVLEQFARITGLQEKTKRTLDGARAAARVRGKGKQMMILERFARVTGLQEQTKRTLDGARAAARVRGIGKQMMAA